MIRPGPLITKYSHVVIETPAVKQGKQFIEEVIESRAMNGSPIGLLFGDPGSGKTVIVQTCSSNNTINNIRLLLSTPPRVTPSSFAHTLSVGLNNVSAVKPLRWSPTNQCIEMITQNEPDLMVIDNAECLSLQVLDIIQEIREKSRTAILLSGLRDIRELIQNIPAIEDDIKVLEIPELRDSEILDIVLPNLDIHGWRYDSNDKRDRELGKYILSRTQLSFRQLRILIQLMVMIAAQEKSKLNKKIIDQALRLML